jgi:hypothetical protein
MDAVQLEDGKWRVTIVAICYLGELCDLRLMFVMG